MVWKEQTQYDGPKNSIAHRDRRVEIGVESMKPWMPMDRGRVGMTPNGREEIEIKCRGQSCGTGFNWMSVAHCA